jgi:hypothetical protein
MPAVSLAGGLTTESEEETWSSFLPLLADQARERGFDLPRPFGVGFNVMNIWQDYDINSFAAKIDGFGIPLEGVEVSEAIGTAYSMDGRIDAWILPFLNVYGVFGYTSGETRAQATVPPSTLNALPGIPPGLFTTPLTFPFDIEYEGFTYGGGATLAYGYKWFFASLDYNYTETDLDIANSSISAHVLTPRVGWNGTVKGMKGAAWVGAMYQDVTQHLEGTIENFQLPLPPPPYGPGPQNLRIQYEAEEEATDPWNMVLGVNLELSRNFNFLIEGGFLGREQLLTALTLRF